MCSQFAFSIWWCYDRNACPHSIFICRNTNPSVVSGAFGRSGRLRPSKPSPERLNEWDSFMNEICALKKTSEKAPLPLPLMMTQKDQRKDGHELTRKWLSPDVESVYTFIFEFPASWTMRNKFLAYICITQFIVFCYSIPNRLRHTGKKEDIQ